jgi:hypothetical protein
VPHCFVTPPEPDNPKQDTDLLHEIIGDGVHAPHAELVLLPAALILAALSRALPRAPSAMIGLK